MKPNIDNIADLEAAFEAVKGVLFGPLDPALVKLKHKEIIIEAKERREQEFFTLGGRSAASDDHAERGRKDRLETLLLVITSQNLAEKLHETYIAFDDIRDKARELLERIEGLLKDARHDYQSLISNAARHPVTGEPIFPYADGRVETEDGRTVPPEEVQGVDFKGKTMGDHKDAGQSRISELEQYKEEATGIDNGAVTHQERTTDPELDEDEREQVVDEAAKDADGLRNRLEEIETNLGATVHLDPVARHVEALPTTHPTITKPSL